MRTSGGVTTYGGNPGHQRGVTLFQTGAVHSMAAPPKCFLLVAAVLVIAASFLTGCMHRYSVCIPTNQGSECMAGYTKEQAKREYKTLYFFTDPEVVKTPKGVGKKANDLKLPNDSGKQTGKPI